MSWLQLELSCESSALSELEDLLLARGAVALTLVSDSDEPVLEPAPGETPLWSVVRLRALYDLTTDMTALRQTLQATGYSCDVQFIGAEDWQSYARTFAVTRIFGNRLLLRPPLAADEVLDDAIATVLLEPGMAFGSGSHPTTCLCLEWLAANVETGQRVLDFGCGSGILAIAAARLGAEAMGVDHDLQAIEASRENAQRNDSRVEFLLSDDWQVEPHVDQFDVVVANILAEPLKTLAADIQQVVRPAGAVVLTGILPQQADEVMAAYEQVTFSAPVEEEGWVRLQGQLT